MRPVDFDRSIRAAFQNLLELDLTDWDKQISLRSMIPPEEYKRIVLNPNIDYEEAFKIGLRYRAYNFMLEDYSYFQFWHDSKHQPRRLRHAYFPNPFQLVTPEELLLEIGAGESQLEVPQMLSQVLEEAPVKIGKPVIRYDLALDDRAECEHPASHFTVGYHAHNRWPVSRTISPRLFVLFVAKHYYPEKWFALKGTKKTKDGFLHRLDQAMAEEKTHCPSLDKTCFSANERRHIFLD